MKFLKMIKSKISAFLSKKQNAANSVKEITNLQQTNEDLISEIKKLNSRISFMAQKMEELKLNQDQIMCQVEQVLFHASGSFATEENNINENETKIENGKNVVQIKSFYRLN